METESEQQLKKMEIRQQEFAKNAHEALYGSKFEQDLKEFLLAQVGLQEKSSNYAYIAGRLDVMKEFLGLSKQHQLYIESQEKK